MACSDYTTYWMAFQDFAFRDGLLCPLTDVLGTATLASGVIIMALYIMYVRQKSTLVPVVVLMVISGAFNNYLAGPLMGLITIAILGIVGVAGSLGYWSYDR